MLDPRIAAALVTALALFTAQPAFAAGEIIITNAKALARNVTPGDAAGYPVSLTRRGAYQLASALYPPANQIGIQILAADVTIDLNGFLEDLPFPVIDVSAACAYFSPMGSAR